MRSRLRRSFARSRLSLALCAFLTWLAFTGGERLLRGASPLKTWQTGELLTAKDLNANFALLATAMPSRAVVQAFLSAADIAAAFDATGLGMATGAYAGWAICNGRNGTPDLGGRFIRVNNAAAGATGGSDTLAHTHAIDHDHAPFTSAAEAAHTHGTPPHQHLLPVGFDGAAVFLMSDGTGNGLPAFGSRVQAAEHSAPVSSGMFFTGNTRQALTDSSGASTTSAGTAHAHAVDPPAPTGTSGPASATDNRPAYFELVALMRL